MPQPTPNPKSKPTTSGITHLPTGASVIPSSTRPDGSTRREIRVRPGYQPPEDQEKYRNRVAQARSQIGTGGVPGAEERDDKETVGVSGVGEGGKNKNAKRRDAAARRKAEAAAGAGAGDGADADGGADGKKETDSKDPLTSELASALARTRLSPPAPLPAPASNALLTIPTDPSLAERDKKIRSLRKKLRQARELRDKSVKTVAGGDVGGPVELLPEQLAKVRKIQELRRELEALGVGADENEDEGAGKGEGEGGRGGGEGGR